MDKKSLSLISGFLGLTSSVAAQLGESGEVTSITEMMSQLIGIDVGDPYALAGVLASTGVLWVTTYIILKVGLNELDVLDKVTPSSTRSGTQGRNLVAVLSLLIVLSMLGTGAFATVISSWQALVGMTFGIGIVILLLWVVLGGTGLSIGGSTFLIGKSGKAATKGIKEGAEAVEEADELLGAAEREEQDAEQTGNDAEARDAAEKLEQVIKDLKTALDDVADVYEKDESQLENILDEIETAKYQSKNARGPEKDFENRLEEVKNALAIIGGNANAGSNSGVIENVVDTNTTFTDYSNMMDSVEQIHGDLEALAKKSGTAEAEMSDAMKKVAKIVNQFEETEQLLSKLSDDIKEAKKADNFEERLAKEIGDEDLYDEAEVEERQVRTLGEELEAVEEKHDKIKKEIGDAVELVEKQLQLDESELEELERVRENLIPDLKNYHQNAEEEVADNPNISPGGGGKDDELINVLEAIKPGQLEKKIVDVEERMRGSEGTIQNIVNSVKGRFT